MIRGIGTDLLDKKRIEKLFLPYGEKFINKILSEREKKELKQKKNQDRQISYLSNNFACKEAFSKALGLGFSEGLSFKDVEILRNRKGAPRLELSKKVCKKVETLGFKRFHITISDTEDFSLAFIVGEGK